MVYSDDYETLKRLEESLWIADTRFDSEYMDKILSSDFFEFGRSGRIYTREEILTALPQKINATLPLINLAIHHIDKNVALVTYVSKVNDGEILISNRSSLWSRTANGWQLRFHQGTPC